MEDIDDTDFISKEEICEATYKTLIDEEDTKMKGSYFSLITGKKYAYNNLGDFIQLIFDHPKISPGSLIASRRYTTINPALFDKEIPNFFETFCFVGRFVLYLEYLSLSGGLKRNPRCGF